MSDLVNHPAHYEEQSIKLEPIDFCERLPFCEGNAIKYCFRAGHKEGASELLDLKKAQWYMNRWRESPTKLKMSYTDRRNFSALVGYLSRSNGVLGKAAQDSLESPWSNDPGEFWSCLYIAIGLRIRELKEAKNDK